MAAADDLSGEFERAAQAVREAKALVVTAGAGIGVDSGLPDYRGPEGFWKAYPPLRGTGLGMTDMGGSPMFEKDPELAWGFYGHRIKLYTETKPHHGFKILRTWGESMENGYFVFTSNVDGQFQKAGFDPNKIVECHGSIHYLQCVDPELCPDAWPVPDDFNVDVIEGTLRAKPPLPMGPPGSDTYLARPNVLMFDDWNWISERTGEQWERLNTFLENLKTCGKFVVVEIGAGLAIPSVRLFSEDQVEAAAGRGTLIRINPGDPQVPEGHISVPCRGLDGLTRINDLLWKNRISKDPLRFS